MTREKASYVAIVFEGQREIHMAGGDGVYATLCGLDGDDPGTRQFAGGRVLPGEHIDCKQCRRLWEACQLYSERDFA